MKPDPFAASMLRYMAQDNAKIAADFLKAGLPGPARQHLARALEQLDQAEAVCPSLEPEPLTIEA